MNSRATQDQREQLQCRAAIAGTSRDAKTEEAMPAVIRPAWHDLCRSLLHLFGHHYWTIAAFALGIVGAFLCFGFTLWLSEQIFECPSWAVNCEIKSSVQFFRARLGLVQGILSSLYSLCISGIAYALYQMAETTLWPLLCQKSMTLPNIDQYLAHSRGSLASFPHVLWHGVSPAQSSIVVIVCIIGSLLHANSTIVGWALTLSSVATELESVQYQGGGMGFGFQQSNPPVPFNGEVQRAATMYTVWSSGESEETLPELRNYIIDRNNFSSIGNFTVGAVRASQQISCYGTPLPLIDTSGLPEVYSVATNLPNILANGSSAGNITALLRFTATAFTLWVNSTETLNTTAARTTIMFAALNSTFEGGDVNSDLADYCNELWPHAPGICLGISSLACDVVINLEQGQACNGECATGRGDVSNVTWIGEGGLQVNGNTSDLPDIAISMAAGCTQFGPFIRGAQPLFQISPLISNGSSLPTAYSDWETDGPAEYYRQADLVHFIDVTAGAMGIAFPQGWPKNATITRSRLDLTRLFAWRSYILLIPPVVAVASVILLTCLSVILHRRWGIREMRLAGMSEIFLSGLQGNLSSVVEDQGPPGNNSIALLEAKELRLAVVNGTSMALQVQDISDPSSQHGSDMNQASGTASV